MWLGPSCSALAVFLDGEMLYTDCPEADNRIGYLALSAPECQRTQPVAVTLPGDYLGKTLTVAQGGFPYGTEGEGYIRAVPVSLSWGYAYESELIAESFRVAIPAAALFLMEVSLLVLFCWQVFHGRGDIGLVCAAMAAVLWMTSWLALTSFAYAYFGDLTMDAVMLCRDLSRGALLAFLTSRSTAWRRVVLGILTGVNTAQAVLYSLFQMMDWDSASNRIGGLRTLETAELLSLLAALALGYVEWRRDRGLFHGLFVWLTAAGIAGFGAAACVMPQLRRGTAVRFGQDDVQAILQPLTFLMMATAIIAATTVAVRRELERRTEARLLAHQQDLAQANYETMRAHQEQVMILRHDMAKHLRMLRQMTGEPQVAAYLDELIGENEKIRPVLQSGNEMLDIILNSKITEAMELGIHVEVIRVEAPEKLPLSGMELCSMFVNLMDNAIAGAGSSGAEKPYIRLDLHIKSGFFVFSCKNSAAKGWEAQQTLPDEVPRHGLGLKIIRHISQRYGDLMEAERSEDYYKVMVVLPVLPGS